MSSPTNGATLRKLMADHRLKQTDVAKLAGVALKTAESWLADPKSASHRRMPARHLTMIRAMLPGFTAAKRGRK